MRVAVLIVYNPAAGRRRAQLLWRVLDVMAANGVKLDVAETEGPGHAAELARAASVRGARLVVAAGGDGTIAEVASGLNGSGSRLGVIPLGTANVLAHELGLPFAPEAVAAALVFGRTRTVWPGLVQGQDKPRLFVQMLGAGLDAQVVHRLPGPFKRSFGRAAYVAQTMREILRYRFRPIEVEVDGACREVGGIIVSKGRFYAGGFMLAPDADPSVPGFSVALFAPAGPIAALAYGAALPLDMLSRMPGLTLCKARHIRIRSREVPAQTDGDPAGMAPLVVTDAPASVGIVVS